MDSKGSAWIGLRRDQPDAERVVIESSQAVRSATCLDNHRLQMAYSDLPFRHEVEY